MLRPIQHKGRSAPAIRPKSAPPTEQVATDAAVSMEAHRQTAYQPIGDEGGEGVRRLATAPVLQAILAAAELAAFRPFDRRSDRTIQAYRSALFPLSCLVHATENVNIAVGCRAAGRT